MSTPEQNYNASRTFQQKLLVWAWNLINAVLGGAATAGSSVLGGAMIGAATFTPKQLLSLTIGGAAVALFNYIRTNKLPPMFDGDDNT